jgi:hypothetical protein
MYNIEKYYLKAIPIEIESGKNWYSNSKDKICKIADKYNIRHEIAIAVCSALSPRCIWESNIKDMESLLSWYSDKKKKNYPKVTTYNSNKMKAISILENENTNVFNTAKTFNFFQNLLNPDNPDYVTIDGHGINIYYGKTGMVKNKHFTDKYYYRIAKAYKKVAKKYNLLPNQLQAIVWLSFKRIHNIKVNWRYYQTELPF